MVAGRLRLVRMKRMPMGFVKAADVMNQITTVLAASAAVIPFNAKEVHVDNARFLSNSEWKLQEARKKFW